MRGRAGGAQVLLQGSENPKRNMSIPHPRGGIGGIATAAGGSAAQGQQAQFAKQNIPSCAHSFAGSNPLGEVLAAKEGGLRCTLQQACRDAWATCAEGDKGAQLCFRCSGCLGYTLMQYLHVVQHGHALQRGGFSLQHQAVVSVCNIRHFFMHYAAH